MSSRALELLSSALTLAAVWTLAPFVHRCDQDSCISMPHWSSALGLSEQSKYLNSNLELRLAFTHAARPATLALQPHPPTHTS